MDDTGAEELERSRELLRHTEQLTDIGGWEVDAETGEQRWTDGTYHIHDLDPDGDFEPTVDSGIEFYHPEDRPVIESAVEACLESGETYEFELRLVTAEERVRWVRTHGEPIFEGGEIVGARGAIQDITVQKQRERELERLRDFFMEAENLGNLGAWEFDDTGSVTWTAGTRKIHEVGDEFTPNVETALDFFHPGDRETVEEAVSRALDQGESFDLEVRLVTATGDQRWVRTRGKPQGDGSTVRGYIQDITGQKERERELRDTKTQLEAAVAAGKVGTWEWDVDRDSVVIDPGFADVFDVDSEGATEGLPLDELLSAVHADDRERVETEIQDALERCGEYESEYRLWNADGGLQWVTARGEVECDSRGRPVRFPGVLIDITEQKEAEEQISVLNRVLRHNLRNELTIIRGYVAGLQASGEGDGGQDTALAAIDRLIDLSEKVRKLIAYTDPDVERNRASVGGLFERAVRDISPNYPGATFSIRGDTDHTIDAYPSLELAVRELVENAAKHAGDAPTIELSVESRGDLLDITVADDGPGLPEQELAVLNKASEKPLVHGSGIGIWLVDLVSADHDGALTVNTDDGGTALTLSLPRDADTADGVSKPAATPTQPIQERYRPVFEKSFDAILILDGAGHITDVNSAAEDLFGVPRSDMLGRRIDRFSPEFEWTGSRISPDNRGEFTVVRPDGAERTVEYTMADDVILDRYFVVLRDVTERRERERELERTERQYQAVFDDPNIMVASVAPDGRVWDINATAMEYVDGTREEILGKKAWQTPWFGTDSDVQEQIKSCVERASRGEYVEIEVDLRLPDGGQYTIEGVFRPVTDEEGSVVAILVSGRDVSERRAQAAELLRTTALLSALFETVPFGILAEDSTGTVLAANKCLVDLFDGLDSVEALVGQDADRVAEQASEEFADPERFLARTDELVDNAEAVREERFDRRDGGTYVRSGQPIDLPDGNGYLWVYRSLVDEC